MCYFSLSFYTDVRSKSLHASENLSTLRCMSADPAFRVQSSANRKSLMMSVIEQRSVRSVSDADSNVTISKSIRQHGGEH